MGGRISVVFGGFWNFLRVGKIYGREVIRMIIGVILCVFIFRFGRFLFVLWIST